MCLFKNKKIPLSGLVLFAFGNIFSQVNNSGTLTIATPKPAGDYIARDKIVAQPGSQFIATATDKTRLYIDNTLILPTVYSSGGANGTNPITYGLDLSKPVGSIPYTFNVTPIGSASCNVPIFAPSGTAGMQPDISLAYSSLSPMGILGTGWNISGISSISRSGRTIYHNAQVQSVILTNLDAFNLDGNRLIPTNGLNGDPNTVYATESESFNRITSYNAIGGGPGWFKVETKNGITIEYGNSTDSKLILLGNATVLEWKISKMYDSNGNYMLFNYNNVNGEVTIKEILYTGNIAANIPLYNSVKFYYQASQQPNSTYVNNGESNQTTLLRHIEVTADGEITKKYNFNYTLYHTNSYLTEIEETGSDNSVLNPLKFSYGIDDAPSTTVNITKSTTSPFKSQNILLDFNGDGKKDLVSLHYDNATGDISDPVWFNWESFKNTGNSTFQSTSAQTAFIPGFQPTDVLPIKKSIAGNMLYEAVDFNGDSKEDLLFMVVNTVDITTKTLNFYPYISNGNTFDPPALPVSVTVKNDFKYWIIDKNGDRKMDLLVYSYDEINNTSDIYLYYDFNTTISHHQNYPVSNYPVSTNIPNFTNAIIVDIDGDGISEFANVSFYPPAVNLSTKYIFKNFGLLPDNSLTDYSTLNYDVSANNSILMYEPFVLYGDFNGDGKSDNLKYYQSGQFTTNWSINLGKGNNFYKNVNVNSSGFPSSITNKYFLTRDINGDGKTDVLEFNLNTTTHRTTDNVTVYYSTGLSFIPESFTIDMIDFSGRIGDLDFGDFNGDGTEDLFITGGLESLNPTKIFYFKRGAKSKFIAEIYDGMGKSTQFKFDPLTIGNPTYSKVSTFTYPLSEFQGALNVVKEVITDNGVGGTNTTTYSYEDAILHKLGKGLIGFKKTTSIDITQDVKNVSIFDFNPTFFNLKPISIQSFINSTNAPLSTTTFQNSNVSLTAGKRYFSKVDKMTTTDHITSNIKVVDYIYNTDGNLTSQTSNLNSGFEIITSTATYIQKGSWLPNKIEHTETTTTRNGEAPYTRTVDYEYDTNGNLNKKTNDISSISNSTIVDYIIDANTGLATQQTLSSGSLQPKLTHWEYDIPKFRFIIKSYNVLNQVSEVTYDNKWSRPLTTTSIDGLVTTYNYDGFGKTIYTETPDGMQTTAIVEYTNPGDITGTEPLSVANMRYKITTTHTAKPTQIGYYDLFGREVKTQTEGFNAPVFKVKSYDAKGRPFKESSGYQTSMGTTYLPVINTLYYDVYNRNTHGNASDGTNSFNTYYSYSFTGGNSKITGTMPDGKTTSKTTDPTGLTISTTDNGGTILNTFYSNHKIKEVSVNGVQINYMEYDDVGHQTKLLDKNAGLTTYIYDAFGLLKSTTDANNKIHTFIYNNLDRVITKTNSLGTTTYQYVTAGGGINQPLLITSANGITQTFVYDNLNRPITFSENINGNVFTTSYVYDLFNNVEKLTYPSGFAIKKEYLSNGYLKAIKRVDNSTLIWQQDEMNPLGQSTKFTNGNQIQTIKTFNNFGTLSNITASGVQNLSLDFNLLTGNLMSRTDNLKGLTENFTYDNLDRLTQSIVAGTFNQIDVTYGNMGNILDKTDVGATSFNNAKINALETATNPIPDISLNQQDITYTPFNKVATITEGDYQYNITYDANEDRKKTESFYQSNLVSTKYYHVNYEKEITPTNTRLVHYIAGTNAMYVIDNGVGTMYYLYTDHLGTINTITDDAGSIVLEQSFDAWGRKRNHTDWTNTTNTQYQVFNWFTRGYTGHEHLYQFGLINMNGRLYSPIESQMLSPDPYNQNPDFTQNYNRYMYAYSNPLKYSDPSGYITIMDVIAGVAIVVGVVLLATGYGSAVGGALLGAGLLHFAAAAESYQHGGTWDEASNYAGINFSISYTPDTRGTTKQPTDYGVTEYDNLLATQSSQGQNYDSDLYNGGPLFVNGNESVNSGAYNGNPTNAVLTDAYFVGFYLSAPVFEHPSFNAGGGVTVPPFGIFVGQGVYNQTNNYDKSLLGHEYGHWDQYNSKGPGYFYGIIAPASVYFGSQENSKGWTELDASNRGYNILNKPWWWDHANFPLTK